MNKYYSNKDRVRIDRAGVSGESWARENAMLLSEFFKSSVIRIKNTFDFF